MGVFVAERADLSPSTRGSANSRMRAPESSRETARRRCRVEGNQAAEHQRARPTRLNTFGQLLRVTTFGESHGPAIGCVVDGCPPGHRDRAGGFRARPRAARHRHPPHLGAARGRRRVEIPAASTKARPRHAGRVVDPQHRPAQQGLRPDIAAQFRPAMPTTPTGRNTASRDPRGGGRSSARGTTMRVAAAVIAKKWLADGMVRQRAGHLADRRRLPRSTPGRHRNQSVLLAGCRAGRRTRRLHGRAAQVRRFGRRESRRGRRRRAAGLGRTGVRQTRRRTRRGDDVDQRGQGRGDRRRFRRDRAKGTNIATRSPAMVSSNHAGGILGGISSGQRVVVSVAFKPTSSLRLPAPDRDAGGNEVESSVTGRHDPLRRHPCRPSARRCWRWC